MRPAPQSASGDGPGLSAAASGLDHLPIFLQLRATPVAVVGGGQVAERKIELLLRVGAHVTVIAPRLCQTLAARAAAGSLTHRAEAFAPPHLEGMRLVIAATDRREVNAAVSAAARARALPVNVVDDAELSSFYFPAIIDRAPLIVAVGSGGQAPVLARWVREQIEALLPATLGSLARFIGERRKRVQRALAPGARTAFWERIVRGAAGTHILQGDAHGARNDFERELHAAQAAASRLTDARRLGEVYLIGAGPGDPDLLTLRALQLLQQADVILYDRLVPEAVLERARRDARRVFVGKGSSCEPRRAHTDQAQIEELMVRLARSGERVARLKGGDPFVFGRGGEEVDALAQHGIPFTIVPGITAALAAAAAAAIPLTQRTIAQSLTFVTGHALDEQTLDWAALARPHQTVVFYMGVAHLEHICTRLSAAGAQRTLPAALIERATLPGQRVVRGSLASIAALAREARITPPALLLVGEVAALGAEATAAEGPVDLERHFEAPLVPAEDTSEH